MGDSTCLMHGFSYASAIPNESKQGNPMHVLGESISFGRFMTEPLSWEKWSTFSTHKKYVEEAQSYAQPGSVAQKKAFFEAHYKRIAAQKAAAAALLEQQQENAAKNAASEDDNIIGEMDTDDQPSAATVVPNTVEEEVKEILEVKQQEVDEEAAKIRCNPNSIDLAEPRKGEGNEVLRLGNNEVPVKTIKQHLDNLENQETVSGSDGGGTPPRQEERPLLKNRVLSEDVLSVTSKKKPSGLSSLKSSIQRKTWKVPSTPVRPVSPRFKNACNVPVQSTRKSNMDSSMDKNRSSPKSLHKLINSIPFKEPDKEPVLAAKELAPAAVPISSKTPKNCRTPWRTPAKPTPNMASKYVAATPISQNRRTKTPADSLATGSKTSGPKWHILSAVCTKSLTACRNKLQSPTTLSTPFVLRTEERAAKRKQKLEEKFNAHDIQKVPQQQQPKTLKEKAGDELRKLSCTFCFKARPLPDFYKEREMSIINQMKKSPAGRVQTAVLGKTSSNKKPGTASMPSAPPFPSSLAKNNSAVSKSIFKRNDPNPSKVLSSSFHGRMAQALENRSPNIQH